MATAAKPSVGGGIYIAPLTASLPTDASTQMSTLTAFQALGYVSDSGVVRSLSMDSENVKAWGGSVVGVLNTGKEETFKFTLLDANDINALKLVFGDDNVTGTLSAGITVKSNSKALDGHEFVIDMIEANNVVHRICIPNAVVSDVGDISYVDNAAIGYEVTITAQPDSSGQTAYDYMKG